MRLLNPMQLFRLFPWLGYPPTRAASKTASIRPRNRDAVSVFVDQIGCSVLTISTDVIVPNGFSLSGAAYTSSVIRGCALCLSLRQPGDLVATNLDAILPKVTAFAFASMASALLARLSCSGSRPSANSSLHFAASSRAFAKLTASRLPMPIS